MEYYTNSIPTDHHITSPAKFTALTYAAEAVQYAPEQRIDQSQKDRTRELGHVAKAHLALEPTAVAEGLALYVGPEQAHDVAQAALFFTGTAHFDTIKVRESANREVRLAAAALRNIYSET